MKESQNSQLLLIGDFNYPEINFEDNDVHAGEESAPVKFFNCVQDLFLYQHVTECSLPDTGGTRILANWTTCLLTMKILYLICCIKHHWEKVTTAVFTLSTR